MDNALALSLAQNDPLRRKRVSLNRRTRAVYSEYEDNALALSLGQKDPPRRKWVGLTRRTWAVYGI